MKCFEDIVPFSNISNDELYETNVGKKRKFKALTRKQSFQNQDIIEKLNNAMDDPEALNHMNLHLYLKAKNLYLSFIWLSPYFFFILKSFQHYYLLTNYRLIYLE